MEARRCATLLRSGGGAAGEAPARRGGGEERAAVAARAVAEPGEGDARVDGVEPSDVAVELPVVLRIIGGDDAAETPAIGDLGRGAFEDDRLVAALEMDRDLRRASEIAADARTGAEVERVVEPDTPD